MTKKQWTAVLKDGSTATIRHMRRNDREEVVELHKKMTVELWENENPEIDALDFLETQKRRHNKALIAIMDGTIVSFLSVLFEAKRHELAASYTAKEKRGNGINDCLRCLAIRELKINKTIEVIFTPKSIGILKPKYEELIKLSGMKRLGKIGDNLYFKKKRGNNRTLEKILKEKYNLEY